MRLNSTHNDRPLSMRARISIGVILTILLILLTTTHKGPTGDIPERRIKETMCSAEDEVLVVLEGDAYDMKGGSTHCIHIDAFHQ